MMVRRCPKLRMGRAAHVLSALLLGAGLSACGGMPHQTTGASIAATAKPFDGRLDTTPRIAVMSAFGPELDLLLAQLQFAKQHAIGGVTFTTGVLAGKPVVLFLSGVSMVNATMNAQRVLDRFNIQRIVFSGIAGGVDPALHIGDVAVPAQWGQYLEMLMARETSPGQFSAPSWMKNVTLPAFGMLQPRPVEVRSAAQPDIVRKFWFPVDPEMLEVARTLTSRDVLARCTAAANCLSRAPQLRIGGNGVSGQAFMDNKAFREYTFKTFDASVLDMESAAVAMVAYSNGVPFIAFRSLSDLAGGGEGENEMGTFMGLAADNSAKVMLAFLAAWK